MYCNETLLRNPHPMGKHEPGQVLTEAALSVFIHVGGGP